MSRKRRVFIGSSTETKPLVKRIINTAKVIDDQEIEFVTWYEDFFNAGSYVYEDLIKKVITFDFCIMIGGNDDEVTRLSTKTKRVSPRDNVYIEFGLFTGALSSKKVLFLMNEQCTVASDLTGMTMQVYSDDDTAIGMAIRWLDKQLKEEKSMSFTRDEIELLPTVGVATGYKLNFLKPFSAELRTLKMLEYEGRTYDIKSKELRVYVPTYIINDVREYANDLKDIFTNIVDTKIKGFRIMIDPDALEIGELIMYDVPTTLAAVFETVNYIFGVSAGNTEDTRAAKYRAMDNFCDTINKMMVDESGLRKLVKMYRFGEND